MINEHIIITMQLVATLLMSYDYFVSDNLKKRIDDAVSNVIHAKKVYTQAKITELEPNRKLFKPYFYVTLAFALLSIAMYVAISALHENGLDIWIIVVSLIAWLLTIMTAMQGFIHLIGKSILPLSTPYAAKLLYSFLAYSPKKAIAASGILILLITFILRYINAL